MSKTRLEAFSDGVLAIIITIMVLELKVPHGEGLDVLGPLLPVFFSYVLSFIYVGIYWNNHHHLLHTMRHSVLAKAIGKDFKGNLSVVLYAIAIPVALLNQWGAQALYVAVALMWVVPDKRIEKSLGAPE